MIQCCVYCETKGPWFANLQNFRWMAGWLDGWMDGWMDRDVTSFSTVFLSYQDDELVIIKGCVLVYYKPTYD